MQDLPPPLLRALNIGYLFLPLGLALIGGLCLQIAAMRKTLTGGTALALGGLCGLCGVAALGGVLGLRAAPRVDVDARQEKAIQTLDPRITALERSRVLEELTSSSLEWARLLPVLTRELSALERQLGREAGKVDAPKANAASAKTDVDRAPADAPTTTPPAPAPDE